MFQKSLLLAVCFTIFATRNEDVFPDEALIQNVIERERRQQHGNNQACARGEELREVLKTFVMNRP